MATPAYPTRTHAQILRKLADVEAFIVHMSNTTENGWYLEAYAHLEKLLAALESAQADILSEE